MSYQRFDLFSVKNSGLGEYHTHDGTVVINCDMIQDEVKDRFLCVGDDAYILLLNDTIIHEDIHKFISEAVDDNETFNEQDERVFRIIRDWVCFDKVKNIVGYD